MPLHFERSSDAQSEIHFAWRDPPHHLLRLFCARHAKTAWSRKPGIRNNRNNPQARPPYRKPQFPRLTRERKIAFIDEFRKLLSCVRKPKMGGRFIPCKGAYIRSLLGLGRQKSTGCGRRQLLFSPLPIMRSCRFSPERRPIIKILKILSGWRCAFKSGCGTKTSSRRWK